MINYKKEFTNRLDVLLRGGDLKKLLDAEFNSVLSDVFEQPANIIGELANSTASTGIIGDLSRSIRLLEEKIAEKKLSGKARKIDKVSHKMQDAKNKLQEILTFIVQDVAKLKQKDLAERKAKAKKDYDFAKKAINDKSDKLVKEQEDKKKIFEEMRGVKLSPDQNLKNADTHLKLAEDNVKDSKESLEKAQQKYTDLEKLIDNMDPSNKKEEKILSELIVAVSENRDLSKKVHDKNLKILEKIKSARKDNNENQKDLEKEKDVDENVNKLIAGINAEIKKIEDQRKGWHRANDENYAKVLKELPGKVNEEFSSVAKDVSSDFQGKIADYQEKNIQEAVAQKSEEMLADLYKLSEELGSRLPAANRNKQILKDQNKINRKKNVSRFFTDVRNIFRSKKGIQEANEKESLKHGSWDTEKEILGNEKQSEDRFKQAQDELGKLAKKYKGNTAKKGISVERYKDAIRKLKIAEEKTKKRNFVQSTMSKVATL